MEFLKFLCLVFLIILINCLQPRVATPPPPEPLILVPRLRAQSLTLPEAGPI